MAKRKLINPSVIMVLIAGSLFLYFFITGGIIKNKFYKNKSNAKVVDSSGWQGRTIEYFLDDGLEINAPKGGRENGKIDINVGDSIVKEANSWEFKVYKENVIGRFEFYRKYHYEKDF